MQVVEQPTDSKVSNRDVADVLFDELVVNAAAFEPMRWEDWVSTFDGNDDDVFWGYMTTLQEALGLTELQFQQTRSGREELEAAYARLGFDLKQDAIAHELKRAVSGWEQQIGFYQAAIRNCDNKPEFAQAKRVNEGLLRAAQASLKACQEGTLIRA